MAITRQNVFISVLFCFVIIVNAEKDTSEHRSINSPKSNESPAYPNKPSSATSIREAILYAYKQEPVKPSCSSSSCPVVAAYSKRIYDKNPCLPLVSCAAFYDEVVQEKSFCKLGSHAIGARCRVPQDVNKVEPPSPPSAEAPAADFPSFPAADSQNAISNAFDILQNQNNLEMELISNGLVVNDPQTPEFGHLQFFQSAPEAVEISKLALAQNIAITSLMSPSESSASPEAPSANPEIANESPVQCPSPPLCDESDFVYRRHDGSCNNLNNPNWGKAFTPFERLSGPFYADGISSPRLSVTGQPLPSTRRVSTHIAHDVDKPSPTYTLSVMQWGQFVDHDITQAPISRFDNMTGIQCCGPTGLPLPPSQTHPECFRIDIPEDDAFYSKFGRKCMNFVRSLPAPSSNCLLGPRNQMNQLSHFLDGSQIYGSTITHANLIRELKDGLLKLQGEDLLPVDARLNFIAGDSRVNEQPHLIIIQTIWARQHNRIAKELLKLNPKWNNEMIYQEARKIVAAQLQHIIYNEWLPIVLGKETVEMYNLLPKRKGCIESYDDNLNPSIINEFASAAFRFGHTLIQGTLKLFNQNYENPESIELSNSFGKPQTLTEAQRFERLVRGLYKQPMQQFDNCVVDDVTNKLFKTDTSEFGLDLVALNIQRGRDHGIGTYNDILSACNLPRVNDFGELLNNMRQEAAPLFSTIYENVDDIDQFIAGISEKTYANGGILGTVFNCVVREQFRRLKFGDRFFYENGGMKHSFTECQLNEIRKTSWARIICDNSKNIDKIQPLAFRIPDEFNTKVSCSSETIPRLDLRPWLRNY